MPSSSESSRLPLCQIPNLHLLQIMRCMDAKTLCRMRQTSKSVDKLAEESRFRLNSYREDSPWNFKICRSRPKTDEGRGDKLEFYIYKSKIKDPYAQLSGISIGTINISDYFVQQQPTGGNFLFFESIETEPGQDVINLLRRLRLRVNWLWTFCTCTPELLSIVRFSRIHCSYHSFSLSEMMRFSNKQALKELYWEKPVVPTSSNCISLLSKLEILSIDFKKYKNEDNYTQFINDIIQATGVVPAGKRTLKSLRICYFGKNWPFSLLFEQAHFYGLSQNEGAVNKHFRLDFHKIIVNSLVLIFLEVTDLDGAYLEIFFIEDYSRSALFDAIWSYFYPVRPAEEVFEGFLNAETENEAMTFLRESTAHAVDYDKKDKIRPIFKKGFVL